MSAKKLEEFIGLIETAERLASKEVAAEGNGRSTSSLWSYPTDIFTPSRKAVNTGSSRSPSISPLRGRKTIDKRRPNTAAYPQVNRLLTKFYLFCSYFLFILFVILLEVIYPF